MHPTISKNWHQRGVKRFTASPNDSHRSLEVRRLHFYSFLFEGGNIELLRMESLDYVMVLFLLAVGDLYVTIAELVSSSLAVQTWGCQPKRARSYCVANRHSVECYFYKNWSCERWMDAWQGSLEVVCGRRQKQGLDLYCWCEQGWNTVWEAWRGAVHRTSTNQNLLSRFCWEHGGLYNSSTHHGPGSWLWYRPPSPRQA